MFQSDIFQKYLLYYILDPLNTALILVCCFCLALKPRLRFIALIFFCIWLEAREKLNIPYLGNQKFHSIYFFVSFVAWGTVAGIVLNILARFNQINLKEHQSAIYVISLTFYIWSGLRNYVLYIIFIFQRIGTLYPNIYSGKPLSFFREKLAPKMLFLKEDGSNKEELSDYDFIDLLNGRGVVYDRLTAWKMIAVWAIFIFWFGMLNEPNMLNPNLPSNAAPLLGW